MDERDEALAAAREMIAQFPDSPLPWFSLGRLQFERSAFAEAAEAFRRCISMQPDWAAALFALGEACEGGSLREEARSAFARCETAARAQNHPSLADEAAARARALEDAS